MTDNDVRNAGDNPAEPPVSAPTSTTPRPASDTGSPRGPRDDARRARSRWRDVAVVLAGGVVGAAIVAAVAGGGFWQDDALGGAELQASVAGDDDGLTGTVVDVPPVAGSGAASPTAAVQGFLTAEADGRLADAFGYLSADDREAFGSAAEWVAAHADVLPQVTGFTVGDSDVDGDRATITGTVAFEPGLDQVLGLTRPRADATWSLVHDERHGWGIDLADSSLSPVYPEKDDGAVDAAARWVRAHQRCAPAGEWDGGLVGSPTLAATLCDAAGAVEMGEATTLDAIDAPAFNAAFGPDAAAWVRVVPVRGPASMRVALAPVGDRWVVIGVLPTR